MRPRVGLVQHKAPKTTADPNASGACEVIRARVATGLWWAVRGTDTQIGRAVVNRDPMFDFHVCIREAEREICLCCTNRHVVVSEREREGERGGRERQTDWLEGMLGYAGVGRLFSPPKPFFSCILQPHTNSVESR